MDVTMTIVSMNIRCQCGRVVQRELMSPVSWKSLESKPWKLRCDGPLSIFAVNVNLRRYDAAEGWRNQDGEVRGGAP